MTLGAGSIFVLAESTEDSRLFDWHKERMDYRREGLEDALDNGDISQDEYNSWSEHFDYMEEFHEKMISKDLTDMAVVWVMVMVGVMVEDPNY